jgi:L-fuculose-phosphate aldolase
LCDLARVLYERGHNAPGDGNLSARLSERYLLCTPTMRHKGRLAPPDIVKVAASDGRSVDPGQAASSEIRMHLAIFASRADVNAIIHAHSPSTVGLTVAGVSMERPVVPEAILALGGIPTVPYESPTTEDVAAGVLPYARRYDAFVLERHGPVALGTSLAEAFARLEVIEHTAKITVAALSAGGARPIPEDEAAHLREMAIRAGLLRDPAGAPPSLGRAPRSPLDDDGLLDALAARVVERLR